MEAGYFGVYLWKAAVEKAGSTDVDAVRAAAGGITFAAPEGTVTIDGPTQHMYKTCLLYTSDAADERSSVDLGGRRIIKKKKKRDR